MIPHNVCNPESMQCERVKAICEITRKQSKGKISGCFFSVSTLSETPNYEKFPTSIKVNQ